MCYNMRMGTLLKNKSKLLILLFALLFSAIISIFCAPNLSASAQTDKIKAEQFLPSTNLEYYSLTSPIDAYSDDDVTAIIQSNQSLIVYYNGEFTTLGGGIFTDLQQVKKLNDDTLLVLDNAVIYTIDLSNNFAKKTLEYNASSGTEPVSCNFFDLNDTHLVTTFNARIVIYTLSNSIITDKHVVEGSSKNPIAISNSGKIFYVNSMGALCSRGVSDPDDFESTVILSSLTPTRMIANDNQLFYVYNHKIHSIEHDGQNQVELIVNANENYDLGKIQYASGISFKGDNLLVTDPLVEAVMEFKIIDDTLDFTGFAVAKDKTAFNRISSSAVKIEKDKNTICVLDDYKLTLANVSSEFSPYDKQIFSEFFADDLGGEMPETFAFGGDFALLSYKHSTSSGYLRLLNVKTRELSDQVKVFEGNAIRDIYFQNGSFFVLADQGNNISQIYRVNASDLTFDTPLFTSSIFATKLSIDVSNNVYLYTDAGELYKYTALEEYSTPALLSTILGVTKFESDLAGGLYALTDSQVKYLDSNGAWQSFEFDFGGLNATISSFALDFDRKDVFFTLYGEELIYKTDKLNNISIDSLLASDFVLSSANANPDNFDVYSILNDENVYAVNVDTDTLSFTFDNLVDVNSEYVYITQMTVSDSFNKDVTFYALAGQNVFVIVNSVHLEKQTVEYSECSSIAFITTRVHAYYLPIITPDDIFVCRDGENVRLSKHQQISPLKKFTFLNKEFYVANATVNDKTYVCYVPVDFTVEILSKDFKWAEHRYETVKETKVYSDASLSTQSFVLTDGQSVKVFLEIGDVLLVTYHSALTDQWEFGYISASSVKNDAQTAVRNVIIIIVVAVCVSATTVYLILKKKKR